MVHKAFEIIGERVSVNAGYRRKEGIFQESEKFQTTAEGGPRPAIDFIEPIYDANPSIEEIAKGLDPHERINPDNPILSLYLGVDHLKLGYAGKRGGMHIFEGLLDYTQETFFNDGNFEVYNKYVMPLKRAGFRIKPVIRE